MTPNAIPSECPPRYIVGIDLGTTNCAVAYIDTHGNARAIRDFSISQYIAPNVTEPRDTLPSFLYALTPEDVTDSDRRVHPHYRAGLHARDHGALTPGRLISSAKSWLCHAGVDRKASILPWHAAPGVKTISPVEAQSILLRHIRNAWDEVHPDQQLAAQEVYITVPASFDEVARELTLEAAKKAGYPALILIEEPQAAFYAWLARHEQFWSDLISADDHILVCDVGGGTTDLTLIHARPDDQGQVVFHRTAVGEHLILGGDNLDLALAHFLEKQFAGDGQSLDARSWSTLVRLCRHHKEYLLSENAPDSLDVVLPGSGSGLLRNQRRATLGRTETESLLLDGFMPKVEWDSRPAKRSSGFQEFGLPFAADPAITKYLAEFLRENLPTTHDGRVLPPKAILLNGGLFESPAMRTRLKDVLSSWFRHPDAESWLPVWLEHDRLDLAVARGAAYFGLARRGLGVKVISNLARAYYLEVETEKAGPKAVCVAPASLSSGQTLKLENLPLLLRLKTPVEFPLYVSSRRTTDRAGEMVDLNDEMLSPLPPVRTVMTASRQAVQTDIHVQLTAHLTELGTLELAVVECNGERSWKLGFDLRAATRSDLSYHDGAGERSGVIDEQTVMQAASALRAYFDLPANVIIGKSIVKELETIIGCGRNEWPVSVLRSFWKTMMDIAETRNRSAPHEQRWLNLTGFFLRPGFGFAIDDWRISETWKIHPTGVVHSSHEAVCAEWWIMWRRLAGGLSQGQQVALGHPVMSALKSLIQGKPKGKITGGWHIRFGSHEIIELLRMMSLLERYDSQQRETLGHWLLERITLKKTSPESGACLWALGHLGARTLLYGPMHQVIKPEIAGDWLQKLCGLNLKQKELSFALMSLARRTGDRYLDIDAPTRQLVVDTLRNLETDEHLVKLVLEGGRLAREEQEQAFGDALPRGLRLVGNL